MVFLDLRVPVVIAVCRVFVELLDHLVPKV
jgi:hypothetical protein